MNNNYSNSYYFRFSPVSTFGYSSREKYAAGWLDVDSKGNAEIKCNNYSYCNYYELLGWLACNFQEDYFYRRTNISFYGKNTRSIKIGRTSISVSAEDKIKINGECFIPDLILALRIIKLYDNINPYGFDKNLHFTNKTNEEILDFFEVKFTSYIMRGEELKKAKSIPSSESIWELYINSIKNEYKERE